MRRTESRRSQRIGDLIMREVAVILSRELGDPRLEEVTVSGARMNADLSVAEVLYSLHDPAQRPEVQKALENAAGLVRRKLGGRLTVKHVPEIRFIFDDYLEGMVYGQPTAER
jgi:ribosome-binding factor A